MTEKNSTDNYIEEENSLYSEQTVNINDDRLKTLNSQKNTSLHKEINKTQTNVTNNPQINIGKAYYDKAYKYENGIGVVVDKNFAVAMYEKSLEAGYLPAQDSIRRLKRGKVSEKQKETSPIPVVNNQQTNVTNSINNNDYQRKYTKAQNSKLLFDQAVELKRKGQYTAALMLYKQAYNAFPDDPDLQSTMYAMAKIYLLLGDYEKACTLFQDGLTQKLAQHDERTAKFSKKYLESQYYGGMSETDPDYIWFNDLTADYSIFIGLTHLMLENNGAALLIEYKTDFDNHIKSVAGKKAAQPSWSYLKTCHNYGWSRVLAIASESYNRCFDKIDLGYVQNRKQEFLDILETI